MLSLLRSLNDRKTVHAMWTCLRGLRNYTPCSLDVSNNLVKTWHQKTLFLNRQLQHQSSEKLLQLTGGALTNLTWSLWCCVGTQGVVRMEESVPFDESILRRMGPFQFLPAVKITLKNRSSIKRKEKNISLRWKPEEISVFESGYTDMKRVASYTSQGFHLSIKLSQYFTLLQDSFSSLLKMLAAVWGMLLSFRNPSVLETQDIHGNC